jgi:hypothetical protein
MQAQRWGSRTLVFHDRRRDAEVEPVLTGTPPFPGKISGSAMPRLEPRHGTRLNHTSGSNVQTMRPLRLRLSLTRGSGSLCFRPA